MTLSARKISTVPSLLSLVFFEDRRQGRAHNAGTDHHDIGVSLFRLIFHPKYFPVNGKFPQRPGDVDQAIFVDSRRTVGNALGHRCV